MTRAHLYFLGIPYFKRNGQPVELSASKAIALLAYVALTERPPRREEVMDLLWPESAPDAARKNLRNTLWSIRKAFGEEVLVTEGERVTLARDVWVDARALAEGDEPDPDLYRGPLLDGLSLAEAPEWELWLATERARLEQRYFRLVGNLAERYRAANQWAQILPIARRALSYDNLQEPLARAVMEAHAHLGERAEALRQYDLLHAALERELGVEPLSETKRLRDAILQGELRAPLLEPSRPPSRVPVVTAQPPFVGRGGERETMDVEWNRVRGGSARVLLLSGEVGIGKTRLWQEWTKSLNGNVTILETHCLAATQSLPLAPLATLFGSDICLNTLAAPKKPLSPIWLSELSRLIPALRDRSPSLPEAASLPPEEERRQLFEALAHLLRSFEGQPLLLIIDDLHWADSATLDWLAYALDRLRNYPFMLLGTYRPEEAPATLLQLVAEWSRQGVVHRVELDRLEPEEAETLLAALVGENTLSPETVERVQAQSGGNPYFLIELARASPGDVPSALQDLIKARLDRLPGPALQVLQAAAILEPDFNFATLRKTSGRGEEETLDALDTLLDAAMLTERHGRYRFLHPLVGTVVREGLSGARRAFLHKRAAEAREALYAGKVEDIAGQLAVHYAEAGNATRAASYAETAAKRALALSAPAEAIEFYRLALSLDATPARYVGLGRALQWQGDLEGARAVFRTARDMYLDAGDARGVADATINLAASLLPAGRTMEAAEWAARAMESIDPEHEPELHAVAHLLRGSGLIRSGTLQEAEAHVAAAADIAGAHDLGNIRARSLFELGNLQAQRGNLPGALASLEKALQGAREMGDVYFEALTRNNIAYYSLQSQDIVRARAEVLHALSLVEEHQLQLPLQYLYSTRGEIALAEKKWEEAGHWFDLGLAEAEARGNREQVANYYANLGLAAQGRGDLEDALEYLERARAATAELMAPHLQTQIDLWLAALFLERGERSAAERAVLQAEARLAGTDRKWLQAQAASIREALAVPRSLPLS